MPHIETFEDSGWAENIHRCNCRIKRFGWVTWPVVIIYAVIGLIWLYVRLLACQMVPLDICEWSFIAPLILLGITGSVFIVVLWNLWNYGIEYKIKAHRHHPPDTIDDRELQSVITAFRDSPGDVKRHIRKYKIHEGIRISQSRRYSRSGYKQLDKTSQLHVQAMGAITASVLGSLAGCLIFFYTDLPALTGIISAAAIAVTVWFVALYGANRENESGPGNSPGKGGSDVGPGSDGPHGGDDPDKPPLGPDVSHGKESDLERKYLPANQWEKENIPTDTTTTAP